MIKEISSVNNSYIKELLSLRDKNIRIEKCKFIVEGYHLVEEAYKHNMLISVLSTDENSLNTFNVDEKYKVSDAIIKKLSSTKTPQNIIGVVKISSLVNISECLKNNDLRIVILDDVNDPGNLGTIIRTAAALGFDMIISSIQTVDYYNEKVLRATQGAIFKIPLFKMNLVDAINLLKENNIKIYGTSLKSAISVTTVDKKSKLAFVLGNEANGVSEDVLNACDQNIIIPLDNNVESLNVGIAGAILMWELKK